MTARFISFLAGIRGASRLCLFAVTSIILIPPQILVLLCHKGNYAYILPNFWHKALCLIFSIKIKISGEPEKAGPLVYIGNHLSYLDIIVLGAVLKGSFISKKEVAPFTEFGLLQGLQQTAFVMRRKSSLLSESDSLEDFLKKKKNLILFPEGTSTEGSGVLPFKSSLFSIFLNAAAQNIRLQPFTIKLATVSGMPADNEEAREIYAWHINQDIALLPHLWRFAKGSGAAINLIFHKPLPAADFDDRKQLARHCHEIVLQGLDSGD